MKSCREFVPLLLFITKARKGENAKEETVAQILYFVFSNFRDFFVIRCW